MQELEQRIELMNNETSQAQNGERLAKKELKKLRFEMEELQELNGYLEQKYHALVKRMGVR